jgi:hypothetical protein
VAARRVPPEALPQPVHEENRPINDPGSSRRQIEFPPLQTHVKGFELGMLAISILCVIIVLVIVLFTDIGTEFRPTV